MSKSNSKEFIIQSQLLLWYKKNKRRLPWRKLGRKKLPNQYYVLISEFMLQQTTVNTVVKRFSEFIKLWPNIKKLSKINENKILEFWSGLGYYARAKNLLKTAKIISLKFNNIIPAKYDELIGLPGVGDYTAKAILGIGYNKSVMPVDTNIERIIARLHGITKSVVTAKKDIIVIAERYTSKKHSTKLIQAFMDYGSKICLPHNPNCYDCIISKHCIAKQKNFIHIIPKKKKSRVKKPIKFTRAYIILNNEKEVLIRRRPPKGMLPSMLEVPNDKWVTKKNRLEKDKTLNIFRNKLIQYDSIRYSFSHFDLEVDIFLTNVQKIKLKGHEWILLKNINSKGMPTIMKKILDAVNN